jgi:hypothetical protein
MRARLKAFTDAGSVVVFDPAAVKHLIETPYDRWYKRVEEEARNAHLAAYSFGGSGSISFEVFLDDHPDAELLKAASRRDSGQLEVPSGELVAGGMEHLTPNKLPALDRVRIPPGLYTVELIDLDWGEEPDDAAEEAKIRAAGTPARVAHDVAGMGTGCLFASTVFLILPFLAIIWSETSLSFVWELILDYGPYYLAAWIFVVVLWKVPGVRQIAEAERGAYDRYPGALLILSPVVPGSIATPRGLVMTSSD